MARKSFSVLFFIKKAKLLKNGEAPVGKSSVSCPLKPSDSAPLC